MPNCRAIFFDMDGLLVETEPLYFQATREVLASVGVEISRKWYIQENLAKGTNTFSLAQAHGIAGEAIERLRKARNERYAGLLQAVRLVDGALDALAALRGHLPMGIVTSSRKDHFSIIMERTALRDYFDFFITGDDVAHTKPDPEPYLRALELSGQRAERCLVLEDSARGLSAAKAAGLTCWVIPGALTRSQDLSRADRILASIREVPALVL